MARGITELCFRPGFLSIYLWDTTLAWLFDADQRPTNGLQVRYKRLNGHTAAAGSGFGEMLVFRKTVGIGVPLEAVLTLTDAVRRALMSVASEGGKVPSIINGHESDKHCAIAALPFVGRKHADGRVMGFGLILPREARPGSVALRWWLHRA